MVRLAHSSDSLALPQAVACFFLLFSIAQPVALAQYFVDGRTWKYGDPLSPGIIVDPPKQEQESQAKNNQPQDDDDADTPSTPQSKPGSTRRPGTHVPSRQHTYRQTQLLQDDNGNYFLWLRGPGGAHGASELPQSYSNLTVVDPPAAPLRPRASPAHRQMASRRPSYYYYYYTVPTNPY